MSHRVITTHALKPGPRRQSADTKSASPRRIAEMPSGPAALPLFLGGRGSPGGGLPRFMASEGPLIQRQCACGADTGAPGMCDACTAEADLPQPKFSLSQPGDRYEQEADRAADAVIAGGTVPAFSPVSADTSTVQTKGDGAETSAGVRSAAQAVGTSGRPLDAGERAFFEPRFGRDFSAVRLHTDGDVGQAARSIHATAYTLNNHIAFAPGAYSPGTEAGRRLMAHELTHTLQQGDGSVIRRTCPTGAAAGPRTAGMYFEGMAMVIRGLPGYRGLAEKDKQLTEHIIEGARGSDCPMYYMNMLHTLFSTTEKDDAEQAAEGAAEIETAGQAEAARLDAEEKKVAKGEVKEDTTQVEEKLADDPGRKWTTRVGAGGKRFYVDARDANNIVVRIKVRLSAAGSGTEEDVKGIKALQDGIEKAAATRGYTFDIVFVEHSGPDVFEADVDTAKWTTAGNWVGDVTTMAHESHHLLGLEDRYNYIESHAGNAGMDIPDRLYWFREQMVRGPDPTSRRSMMSDHWAHRFDDLDVCAVAKEKSEFASCVTERIQGQGMDQLVQTGKALMSNYEPQNAALLRRMADAWQTQCFARYPEQRNAAPLRIGGQRIEKCWVNDCRKPPEDAFGKVYTLSTLWDEWRYPLSNPHDQPAGTNLKREAAPWWAFSP